MKLKRNQYNLNMDWMERSALVALTEHESLRLKQLLPMDVPSNLFSYHLQKLLTTGLIERKNGLYSLTPKGKQLAGQINVDTGRVRPQPKIIGMFYITNTQGQVALFEWKRQPYYDYTSFPYGKFDFGKSLQNNTGDELYKKTSLNLRPKFVTDFYITITQNGFVISHMLVHLFKAKVDNFELRSMVRTGKCFWGTLDDAGLKYFPGTNDVAAMISGEQAAGIRDLIYDLS